MSSRFLMLPPQTAVTRNWAERLGAALPQLSIVVAGDRNEADAAIADADAAFGTLPPDLLRKAGRLRWLQAPNAAPPAGYYYPELIAHSVVVTNFREIFNDHIGAHIMAFVLAFARGLHRYIPQQMRREWRPAGREAGDVIHLPETTALIVGVGGIGAEAARLAAAFGITVIGVDSRREDQSPMGGLQSEHYAGREPFSGDSCCEPLLRRDSGNTVPRGQVMRLRRHRAARHSFSRSAQSSCCSPVPMPTPGVAHSTSTMPTS